VRSITLLASRSVSFTGESQMTPFLAVVTLGNARFMFMALMVTINLSKLKK